MYTERASAKCVVTPDTAGELAEAARELVRLEGVRCADFRLRIVNDGQGGRVRVLSPVRVRGEELPEPEPEPDLAAAAAAATSAATAAREVVAALTRENCELRTHLAKMMDQLLGSHAEFSRTVLEHTRDRSTEHKERAEHLLAREQNPVYASPQGGGDSTTVDAWWQSEPLMQTVASGVENVTSLIACIGASMAGVKVPT